MTTLHVEAQLSSDYLLKAVEQLEPPELERFVSHLLDLKARRAAPSLPSQESKLLARINEGLPTQAADRYQELIEKRRAASLTSEEYAELLRLTDEVEGLDAERIKHLTELARLRKTSLTNLITELGY